MSKGQSRMGVSPCGDVHGFRSTIHAMSPALPCPALSVSTSSPCLVQAAVYARAHASGLGFGFSQFAVFSVYALAFWYGGQLMRSGEMSFNDVLKVLSCRAEPTLVNVHASTQAPVAKPRGSGTTGHPKV